MQSHFNTIATRSLARSTRASLCSRCFNTLNRPNSSRPILQQNYLKQVTFSRHSQQVRHAGRLSNAFRNYGEVFRQTWARKPYETGFGVAFILAAMAYAAYLFNVQVKRMNIDYGPYPEQVGVQLRRAIYWTDHNPNPKKAMAAFTKAIEGADEAQLHQCSDAVIGINIELARFIQTTGDIEGAIHVLERTRNNCMTYIEKYGDTEGQIENKNRLLQKSIQLAMRLGELYGHPGRRDGGNAAKAEEYLVWSVQTTLKENERRKKESAGANQDPIISTDEQGAQLETLGQFYEEKNNFYYASQLFLQALALKSTVDCHTAILMNNLAAAIAQQVPITEPGVPRPSPTQLRDNARTWSKKALELSRSIQPPARNEECDIGCVAATHALGEFAEMDGKIKEARDFYEEAGSLAHAINFKEGVEAADEGLARLNGGQRKRRYELPSKKPKSWWPSF